LLLLLLLSQRALRGELAQADVQQVDGLLVHLTPALGPAVVGGFRRPAIVLPAWIAHLDPDARRLVVRHEAEHVRSGDVRLLALAALAAAACPWNPAVWWQLRGLRDAIELDCDRRLVLAGVDIHAYGALLLEVARHASPRRMAVTLAPRRSLLSRRIDHMTPSPSSTRTLRALAGVGLGALLLGLACEAPSPVGHDARTVAGPQLALEDRPPTLASPLDVAYPPLLRQAGIEGDVVLEFVVDATGRVDSASVIVIPGAEPVHRALEASAARAIRNARYQPAVVNGRPVPLRIRQTVSFRLASPT
jgi:TonB family protein